MFEASNSEGVAGDHSRHRVEVVYHHPDKPESAWTVVQLRTPSAQQTARSIAPAAALTLSVVALADEDRSVEAVARDCLAMLLRAQPVGPYRLFGAFESGLIAYEMTRILIGQDQPVALTVMFETEYPDQRVRANEADVLSNYDTLRASEYAVRALSVPVHLLTQRAASHPAFDHGWRAALQSEQLNVSQVTVPADLHDVLATLATHTPHAARARERVPLLHALRRADGAAVTLACVPGAGAAASDFLALAGALDAHCEVLGFSHRGLDGHDLPHTSVEAAARAYAQALRAHAPKSLHVIGHSWGGWIALELAMQLGSVVSLTLVDSQAPRASPSALSRSDILLQLAKLYELAVQRPLGVERSDLEQRAPHDQLTLLHAACVRANLVPARSTPELLRGPVDVFAAALRMTYRPLRCYEGPATLVVAAHADEPESTTMARTLDTLQRWRRFVPQLRLQRISGNHVTLLRPPHVATLANTLRRQLGTSVSSQ